MLGDEFQQERNVGRSNNRPVLGAATRAYGKHLGEEALVYRILIYFLAAWLSAPPWRGH